MTDPYFTQPFDPVEIRDDGSYIIRYAGYDKAGAFIEGIKQVSTMAEVMKFGATTNVTKMDIEFVSPEN